MNETLMLLVGMPEYLCDFCFPVFSHSPNFNIFDRLRSTIEAKRKTFTNLDNHFLQCMYFLPMMTVHWMMRPVHI